MTGIGHYIIHASIKSNCDQFRGHLQGGTTRKPAESTVNFPRTFYLAAIDFSQ